MAEGQDRSIYRNMMRRQGLVSFSVRHLETDLWIQATADMAEEVSAWVLEARTAVEAYARSHPGFLEAKLPMAVDPLAPEVVRRMLSAGQAAGVGPMAAVAGAIAQFVCERIVEQTAGEAIVENGGDTSMFIIGPLTVGIWAGPSSPFTGRIGIEMDPQDACKEGKEGCFLAVCTSSGTIGHSLSLGRADAAVVVAEDAALADAAATGAGNLVTCKGDIGRALEYLADIPGIIGGVVIKGDAIGAWGRLELVPLEG